MSQPVAHVVFLFDVDNTLLDNDRIQADLREQITATFDARASDRYWALMEELRVELGYVDYLGALQRFRSETMHDPKVLWLGNWLLNYRFADRLYPNARDAVAHVGQWGQAVILSDGDAVFQPRKIDRSGLRAAIEDRVLIYVHKEHELEDVERLYPATHYVVIDDKIRILDAVKQIWGERVTTVFPRQGHYALDPKEIAAHPAADLSIESIGDLLRHDFSKLSSR